MVSLSGAAQLQDFPYKIAVLCDLRDAQGNILLLERLRQPNRGLFSPIGGKLDTRLGESPAQCARREIREETGLDIRIERLHLGGMIAERGYEGQANWLLFYFRVLDPVVLEAHEMREGRLDWHDTASLEDLALPETDRRIIWPLVREHDLGFFAVHIDCTGSELCWTVEQSRPAAARVGKQRVLHAPPRDSSK